MEQDFINIQTVLDGAVKAGLFAKVDDVITIANSWNNIKAKTNGLQNQPTSGGTSGDQE